MKLTVQILLALSTLSTLRVALGGPLVPKQVTSEPTTGPNAFDIGPIDECIVPTPEQLPECHQYVDYAVPAALLATTSRSIKEKQVSGAVDRVPDPCSELARRYQCRLQFPKCTDEGVQFTNDEAECTAALEMCSDGNMEYAYDHLCGPSIEVSQSTCTSVSTVIPDTDYCQQLSGWSDWYVTEWAAVLLREAERDIDGVNEFLSFQSDIQAACVPLYSQLRCGGVGKCWSQGNRLELNATREVCVKFFDW